MDEERGGAEHGLRGAVATGRDLYRRGSIAVARTAGDNQALMLLAGAAVIAGLSWLAARGRGRGSPE